MGTISKATFNRDIAELVEKTADLDLRYQWQFNDVSISFNLRHFQNCDIEVQRVSLGSHHRTLFSY